MKLNSFPSILDQLRGIIPGGISPKDFSVVTKTSELDSKKILDEFVKKGVGIKKEEKYFFEISDKLKIAVELIQNGLPIDEVSVMLDWKNFEGLVAEILSEKNFAVIKNLILTKPRMEIDVIGIHLGVAMLIDCKHWKRYSSSALSDAIKKQIDRTKQYVSKTPNAIAVPVIVTLYHDKVNFLDNVPIVPIFQFSSFVDDFYGNLEHMKTIKAS
jgi:hypothetical protein